MKKNELLFFYVILILYVCIYIERKLKNFCISIFVQNMTRKYFRQIFSIKTRNPGKLLSCNYCYKIYEEYVPNNSQSIVKK